MLKKTVALGTLLTTISSMPTLAHSSYFKSGFMAGAHVGYSWGSGKYTGSIAFPQLPPVVSTTVTGTARKSAPLIGILGGYRHIFNQDFTAGLDIAANIYGGNELTKVLRHPLPVGGLAILFNNRLKRTFSVIPSLMFGKVFCGRYHVSLGLGLGITRFKQQVDLVTPGVPFASASASQTKLGFVPSLGLEYAATRNVSVTGNISYEMYQKIRKTFTNPGFNAGAATGLYTSSISPRYVTLKVGAIYRF